MTKEASKVNKKNISMPNVVFLRRMTANLLNLYQRNSHKELALRLAPYADLLHNRIEQLAKDAHRAT